MTKSLDLVIGASYGDEGKGITVARLAEAHQNFRTANVLTNGGPQRGHTVCMNGRTHVFRHFGSGTSFGAITYFSGRFILNPIVFCEELSDLEKNFCSNVQKPVRHPNCRWTTPFDMMYNQMESKLNWKGTCGMGIWATICRYNNTNPPTFDEFCNEFEQDEMFKFLESVKNYYEDKLDISKFPEYVVAWNSPYLIEHFIKDCLTMKGMTVCRPADLNLNNYEHLIFENGQGLLLGDKGIDDPEKTPSETGSEFVANLIDDLQDREINIHYVTRPYLTRHGSRTFKEEHVDGDMNFESESNGFNEWQKNFLYANLDLTDLKNNIEKDRRILSSFPFISYNIDITHSDEIDREEEFRKVFGDRFNLKFFDKKEV